MMHYKAIQVHLPKLQKDLIIQRALLSTLPDLSLMISKAELNRDSDDSTIVDWIEHARLYSITMHREFEAICEKQLRLLRIVKASMDYHTRFDVSKVVNLPEDCAKHIISYFTVANRLEVNMMSLDHLRATLQTMPMKWLRNILKHCIHTKHLLLQVRIKEIRYNKSANFTREERDQMVDYMNALFMNYGSIYRGYHMPNRMDVAISNKEDAVNRIVHALYAWYDVLSCPTPYLAHELQTLALSLVHSISYVSKKYKEVRQNEREQRRLQRNT
jgi:hypothetical protein